MKFNRHGGVYKKDIEARGKKELDEIIKDDPVLHKNKDRLHIKPRPY